MNINGVFNWKLKQSQFQFISLLPLSHFFPPIFPFTLSFPLFGFLLFHFLSPLTFPFLLIHFLFRFYSTSTFLTPFPFFISSSLHLPIPFELPFHFYSLPLLHFQSLTIFLSNFSYPFFSYLLSPFLFSFPFSLPFSQPLSFSFPFSFFFLLMFFPSSSISSPFRFSFFFFRHRVGSHSKPLCCPFHPLSKFLSLCLFPSLFLPFPPFRPSASSPQACQANPCAARYLLFYFQISFSLPLSFPLFPSHFPFPSQCNFSTNL